MRTIVISDIHGYYQTFVSLLALVNYSPSNDRLVLLGDYVDGGPASLEVVRMVQQMAKNSNVQVIGGNHDDMFVRWLDGEEYPRLKYRSLKIGGLQTIRSFCPIYQSEMNDLENQNYIKQIYSSEIDFLRNLPNYYEDDRHIYVHAGIDPKQNDWKLTSHKNFRWIRGRFYQHDGLLPMNKTIIFGHEVCSRLHKNGDHPWFGKQMIGIDGGIKFGAYLNALIIENNEYRSVSMVNMDN